MAKSKKVKEVAAGVQPEFGEAPRVEASGMEAPGMVEYQPFSGGERWRVEKFGLLVATVELVVEGAAEGRWARAMEVFHMALCGHRRQWLIVRRLFGVCPLVPTKGMGPEDLKAHDRESVCAELVLTGKELEAELAAVQAIYRMEAGKKSEEEGSKGLFIEKGELDFGDDILRKIGLDERVFEGDRETRAWFIEMAKGWKTVLDEPQASTLAAQCLMGGIELRKVRKELSMLNPRDEKYGPTRRLMESMEERYEKQMLTVSKLCPWVGQVDGKISFKGTLSELVKGYHEYYANGDNRLIDRVRTVGEIEVDHRRSVQAPHIRYRFGQTLYVIEAMKGLHDPNFRSQLSPEKLAKFDKIYKRLAEEGAEEIGEPIPDLMKDGEEGEFGKLGKSE